MTNPFLSGLKRRNACLIWLALHGLCLAPVAAETSIDITFLDKSSGDKISSRIEFIKPASKAPRPKNSLVAGRQLLVEGFAEFRPAPGAYEFWVRRGPEYSDVRTGFELEKNAQDAIDVVVPHKTPMRIWGWHSGDLHSSMAPDLLARWMRADDLDVVATTSSLPVAAKKVGPSVSTNEMISPPAFHCVQTSSILFNQPGQGGVLVHRLTEPSFELSRSTSFACLDQFESQASGFVEVTRPWERDVPLLLASGRIDSIQLLSNHLQPETSEPITSSIRNPDALRFKGKKALARLSEHIYWRMLDAGLRLPPTAGSGFDGKLTTHLGYNRVYVWLAPELPRTIDSWWTQLRAGHAMVTNGPLLRATINGQPAGSVYTSYRLEPIPLDIELELTVRDPVEYLDVVFNGQAIYQARLDDHAKRGQFPSLSIAESGWLILRVVTEHENSYRIATTAPFYFEFDGQPRIGRSAVQFFQEWLDESRDLIEKNAVLNVSYQEPLAKAKRFWNDRAEQSNAE